MKIKLSKSQWQFIGQKAGWIKLGQVNESLEDFNERLINELDEYIISKFGHVKVRFPSNTDKMASYAEIYKYFGDIDTVLPYDLQKLINGIPNEIKNNTINSDEIIKIHKHARNYIDHLSDEEFRKILQDVGNDIEPQSIKNMDEGMEDITVDGDLPDEELS